MVNKNHTKKIRIRRCELCGRPLPPQSGRGRPRVFHEDCKRAAELMRWLVQTVDRIDFTPEAYKVFRADMFALANDVRTRVDHEARREAGVKLKERREAAGFSREDLAEASGVKLHRVGHIEIGKRGPSSEELASIETVLRESDAS